METANTGSTQTVVQSVVDDAIQAEKHLTALVAAYKASGASGVAALLPALEPEVLKDYQDVKAALPTIKAGYKTSEFWIVVVVCGVVGYFTAKGTVPPIDGASVIGAVTAVYTVVRGLIKR